MPPKTNTVRTKNTANDNSDLSVLIRDEASQLLILGDGKKTLPVNKSDRLIPGITVSWQDNNRQRWRGPVLAVGTQAHCEKVMSTIEKNSRTINTEETNTTNSQAPKLNSTIIIEHDRIEEEEEHDDNESSNDLASSSQLSPNGSIEDDNNQLSPTDDTRQKKPEQNLSQQNNESLIQSKENISPSRAEKRPLQDTFNESIKKRRNFTGALTVPYTTYSKKEQECLALEAKVANYEQTWMPRPKDPRVIQYLIEITDILRGVHQNNDEDEEERFQNIIEKLNLTENQLLLCHKKSATATARRIMRFLFPIPTEEAKKKLKNEDFIQAVIKYTRLSNPSDPTSDADIRHAMGNYIAAYEYNCRRAGGS